MTKTQILLLIAAFLALTLGSFVWYIATWDARKGVQTSSAAPQLLSAPDIPAPGEILWISPLRGSALSTQITGLKDIPA